MSIKQKLIVIVGPTASGKSDLAVALAKKFDGEIISADSRQVYKYLDIGSNKVPGQWKRHNKSNLSAIAERTTFVYKNIPHYCIDVINPKRVFTVADYKACAEKAIADITNHHKVPILAGGTGFYIQAVVDNIVLPEVPPNVVLRKKLEKKTIEQLFTMLKKLDPERAATIDSKNPRRLMRAIEIVKATGKPVSKLEQHKKFNVLMIGLKPKDIDLKKALAKRTQTQIRTGLLEEVQKLIQLGVSKKRIRELGFEYSHVLTYLETGHPSKKELAEILTRENWRYAKRQMTWFKHDKRIQWITRPQAGAPLVKKFLYFYSPKKIK